MNFPLLIFYCSHSVGAGIASLLTVDVFQRFPQKHKQIFGYTLGKPRVGDKAYARYVAEQGIPLKRYVNGIDGNIQKREKTINTHAKLLL